MQNVGKAQEEKRAWKVVCEESFIGKKISNRIYFSFLGSLFFLSLCGYVHHISNMAKEGTGKGEAAKGKGAKKPSNADDAAGDMSVDESNVEKTPPPRSVSNAEVARFLECVSLLSALTTRCPHLLPDPASRPRCPHLLPDPAIRTCFPLPLPDPAVRTCFPIPPARCLHI